MFVADQNVFLVRRIPIRRREFVLRATFCTTTNVMRKKSVLTQPMTGNPARIFIQGALIITTTSIKKIIKILSCISINNQEKSNNNEDKTLSCLLQGFMEKIHCLVKLLKPSYSGLQETWVTWNQNGMPPPSDQSNKTSPERLMTGRRPFLFFNPRGFKVWICC